MFGYLWTIDIEVDVEILRTAEAIVNRESNVGNVFDE
jgi:hypothetical protein